ncbi:hypothetical protein [Cupriavidus metallidurans]|uniref:hypothetical protein n=1 Tax=Cupriavidus metallidurans TaxID=119219 RepID=UPI000566D234|nr:hypothetical protein [Cupriavidus metallidurans]
MKLNDFGNGVHAVGQLDLFTRFWRKPEMPDGLPLYAMALTCPVTASTLASLPESLSPATISFESVELGGHPIIAIKLTLAGLEIVWLADAKDADNWMGIEFWGEWKVVPIVLGVEKQGEKSYRFFLPAMNSDVRPSGDLLGWADGWGDMEPWTSMAAYCKAHGTAFPVVSTRVPALPRPAGFGALKYLGMD